MSVLVDHYEDDWVRLWWVRVDGTARVVADPAQADSALALLASKYEQYRGTPPPGPVVRIDIGRMSGWSSA